MGAAALGSLPLQPAPIAEVTPNWTNGENQPSSAVIALEQELVFSLAWSKVQLHVKVSGAEGHTLGESSGNGARYGHSPEMEKGVQKGSAPPRGSPVLREVSLGV